MLTVAVSDRAMAGAQQIGDWHVVVATCDPASWLAKAADALSPAERARCDAMLIPAAADLRRAAHVFKRATVGARLGVPPAQLAFDDNVARPTLRAPHAGTHVSLSHTRHAVAVALADSPVGIDIEPVSLTRDVVALSERFFAPDEARRIAAAPESERPLSFAWRWVAKEALLKMAGLTLGPALALSMGAQDYTLPFTIAAHDAHITVFAPAPGFVCAIARG